MAAGKNTGDEAAGQQNAKLVASSLAKLVKLRPADKQSALAECVPIISQFAMSLTGSRREKVSAWLVLDLAIQNRMTPGGVRAVSLGLTGKARRIMLEGGRFEAGRRSDFETDETDLFAAVV